MPDPFLGEIRMFGGNFAPRNFALCDGSILPIAQNQALFSLLGTIYGGDGRTTFALPDLRGRAPVHAGTGPALPQVRLGEQGGANTVALNPGQMPPHSHPLNGSSATGDVSGPSGAVPAVSPTTEQIYSTGASDVQFATGTVGDSGTGAPVDVRQPYLSINFIIALQGVFPSRN